MRREKDDGSVLVLMPAAVLVMLVLGAVTVDLSARFLAQRQAIAAAEGAANDAAAAGVDLGDLDRTGPLTLDEANVRRIALRSIAAQGVTSEGVPPPRVELLDQVTVQVTLWVRPVGVFGPVVGVIEPEVLQVSATARMVAR